MVLGFQKIIFVCFILCCIQSLIVVLNHIHVFEEVLHLDSYTVNSFTMLYSLTIIGNRISQTQPRIKNVVV